MPPPPTEAPLRVATFNAGLARGWVPGADVRAPRVARALADLPADVLCVQELWSEGDFERVRAESERWAHVQRAPRRARDEPCPAETFGRIERCVEDRCGGQPLLGRCMTERCAEVERTTDDACLACVAEQVVAGGSWRRCGPSAEVAEPAVEAVVPGGVALFSRRPWTHVSTRALPSRGLPRVVLHARLEAGIGPVDVFCTHLHGRPTASGAEVHREQIEQLRAFVAAESAAGATTVLLGDFNCGPAAAGALAALPAHYEALVAGGFVNPLLAATGDVGCTQCPLAGEGRIVDHVLVRGHRGPRSAKRILRATGEPLSDHVGVAVTLGSAKVDRDSE